MPRPGVEVSEQSVSRLSLKWVCVSQAACKSIVFRATGLAVCRLASAAAPRVCEYPVRLYLAEKGCPQEFRLAVMSPCIGLILKNCVLAKSAPVNHCVVLARTRNEQ